MNPDETTTPTAPIIEEEVVKTPTEGEVETPSTEEVVEDAPAV